jgi:hypothetical protein
MRATSAGERICRESSAGELGLPQAQGVIMGKLCSTACAPIVTADAMTQSVSIGELGRSSAHATRPPKADCAG